MPGRFSMEVNVETGLWAFLSSMATGAATYFATRPRKKTHAEDELTAVEGFQRLADQQRREMDGMVKRAEDAETAADKLRDEARQLRDEAHDLRNRFTRLLGYLQAQMFSYIAELHRLIRENGDEPPPIPPLPDLSPAKKPTF